jgi:hypothetical protein
MNKVEAKACLESALDMIHTARQDPAGLVSCAGELERILLACRELCEIAYKQIWLKD